MIGKTGRRKHNDDERDPLACFIYLPQSVCPRVWERSGIDVLAGSTSTA
jgi:hypothetical protein